MIREHRRGLSVREVMLTQSFLLKSEEQETLTVQF